MMEHTRQMLCFCTATFPPLPKQQTLREQPRFPFELSEPSNALRHSAYPSHEPERGKILHKNPAPDSSP
jgi:hypothetical protein